MKLINERGKLFGLINLVDFILLVVIILGIAAVGYKTLNKPIQEIVNESTPVTVVLRVRGAMPYLVEEMTSKVQPGDRLVSGNGFDNAEVVGITTGPYRYSEALADGTGVTVVDSLKQDILITVKSSGVENAAIFKIGSQEVRTGRGFTFKTNRFEVESIVESVEFDG